MTYNQNDVFSLQSAMLHRHVSTVAQIGQTEERPSLLSLNIVSAAVLKFPFGRPADQK